jgi:hypothetical protein
MYRRTTGIFSGSKTGNVVSTPLNFALEFVQDWEGMRQVNENIVASAFFRQPDIFTTSK